MPLIFSTYKIKLGGIIPTANLFSRFLEKNVEQAVDVFGFHKNPYAYLLFHSWEHKLLNQVEEASNSQFSQAFPFWSDKGIAQHLNSQESASGDFFCLQATNSFPSIVARWFLVTHLRFGCKHVQVTSYLRSSLQVLHAVWRTTV